MIELYNNIKRRRLELGLSQSELAQKAGYTDRSIICKIEKGEVDLSQSKMDNIAKALQTTSKELLGYDDPNVPQIHIPNVPILGEVACGLPMFAEQNIIGYSYTDKKDGVDFALYAHGDSMNAARIMDGDLVYIRQQSAVDNGEIALILVDNETATIKRFYDYGDKVVLRPESFNHEHKEQVYEKNKHDIKIQGKVIFIKAFIN